MSGGGGGDAIPKKGKGARAMGRRRLSLSSEEEATFGGREEAGTATTARRWHLEQRPSWSRLGRLRRPATTGTTWPPTRSRARSSTPTTKSAK
jgi:hypothetical protein